MALPLTLAVVALLFLSGLDGEPRECPFREPFLARAAPSLACPSNSVTLRAPERAFPAGGLVPGSVPGRGRGGGASPGRKRFSSFSGAGGGLWHAWAAWVATKFRVLISFRATGAKEAFSSALPRALGLPVRRWRGRSVGGSQRRGVGAASACGQDVWISRAAAPPGESVRVHAASPVPRGRLPLPRRGRVDVGSGRFWTVLKCHGALAHHPRTCSHYLSLLIIARATCF